MNMNKKNILFMAATAVAAIFVAACGPKSSDMTRLNGVFGDEAPAEVHIRAAGVDTVIAVEGGKFAFSVPVELTEIAVVECEYGPLNFVSDGSKLTFDFSGDNLTVTSSDPKSVTSRLHAYIDKNRELAMAIRAEEDEEKSEELYENYVKYNQEVVLANTDNFLGLAALQNVYHEYEAADLVEVLNQLAPALQEKDFVQTISKAAQAQMNTGEGAMFTDFEIEEEEGKVTKFSDFVGNGKYVLVDFWASWCGPCKREMPYIAAAYAKYHSDKFDVLSVAVWDKVEDTVKAAPELGIVWNQIINAQRIPTEIYGIQGIPHLILFGPDGTILKRGLRGEGIEEELSKYLD